jgi:hypothetical protein
MRQFLFPEPSLLASLIDIYFEKYNAFWPLLHELSFKESVSNERHLKDFDFAQTLLLVCAIASRWSDDSKSNSDSTQPIGFQWYSQLRYSKRSQLAPPTLYDVQFCFVSPWLYFAVCVMCCSNTLCFFFQLSGAFLFFTFAGHSCWTLVAVGLRYVQEAGAHRRRVTKTTMTIEEVLWNRAFW